MVDDRRERGPYTSGLARREAILDAAVEVLSDFGYRGMSLRDVARKVGISHPGVIYHFPSKEALLMAVVERYEEENGFANGNPPGLHGFEILAHFLITTEKLQHYPIIIEIECMLAVEAFSPLHPAYGHFSRRLKTITRTLERAAQEMLEDGAFLVEISPQVFAKMLISLWYGLQQQWLYDRSVNVAQLLRDTTAPIVDVERIEYLASLKEAEKGK